MKFLNRLSAHTIILAIAAAFLAGYAAHIAYTHKTVYGDGAYYWAWLTLHPSKFSVGPALFWAPAFLMSHNEFVVGAVDVAATIFALILLFDLLTKSFSKTVSIVTTAGIAGTTNLLFYGSLDSVNSHSVSFFAVVVYLTLLARRNWFAIGASLAFISMIRFQDILFGILLLPLLSKKNIFPLAAGFVILFLPQLIAWRFFTGKWFVNPYLTHESFDLLHPHIIGVLFGVSSGLFLWTPITLVGVVGLIRSKRVWFFLVFLLELYTVAGWSTWWQGASYSGRMFVSSLPLLAFGIATVFSSLSRYRFAQAHFLLSIVGPLSLINVSSIIYFLLTLPRQ